MGKVHPAEDQPRIIALFDKLGTANEKRAQQTYKWTGERRDCVREGEELRA